MGFELIPVSICTECGTQLFTAQLAQLADHEILNLRIVGSSPKMCGTNNKMTVHWRKIWGTFQGNR